MPTKTELTARPRAAFNGMTARRFSKAKSVADRLGICPRTVFRWADAGRITRHKINARVVLFDEAEVTALIDSARVTPLEIPMRHSARNAMIGPTLNARRAGSQQPSAATINNRNATAA
jgi:hypothetical protein